MLFLTEIIHVVLAQKYFHADGKHKLAVEHCVAIKFKPIALMLI